MADEDFMRGVPFEFLREAPTLKDAIIDMTAFAEQAAKCTPELQASFSMVLQIIGHPSMLIKSQSPKTTE